MNKCKCVTCFSSISWSVATTYENKFWIKLKHISMTLTKRCPAG